MHAITPKIPLFFLLFYLEVLDKIFTFAVELKNQYNFISLMKRLALLMFFMFGLTCCFYAQSKNQCKKEARVGEKLVELVKAKEYEKVFRLLDKVKVKEGYKIKIEPYDTEAAFMAGGDVSSICIYDKDGKLLTNNFEEDFWSYLQVEKSKMGAWQAYLISQMWHYLPLFWHANYARQEYVYTQSSKVKFTGLLDDEEESFNSAMSTNNVTPNIVKDGDKFIISACYWTIFGGLKREKYVVSFKADNVDVKWLEAENLFEYHAPIRF